MLIDQDMKKRDLEKAAGISHYTILITERMEYKIMLMTIFLTANIFCWQRMVDILMNLRQNPSLSLYLGEFG